MSKNQSLLNFIIPLVVLAGLFFTWRMAIHSDHLMRAELLRKTSLIAGAVNLDDIRALSGTEADLENPAYARLKNQFATIIRADSHSRFLYLMGRNADGLLFFFVDNEAPDSENYSPPGQIYSEAAKEFLRVFETCTWSIEGPVTDRWGTWISAAIPITDPATDQLLAVLNLDVNAWTWKWDVAARTAPRAGVMWVVLIGILVGLSTSKPFTTAVAPKPVLRRLLPPLASLLILMTLGISAILWQQHRTLLSEKTAAAGAEITNALENALDQQSQGLASTAKSIAMDERTREALQEGNTERLLSDWRDLFETLRTDQHLTHFYFFDSRRVCLLRVHKPEKCGDLIERFTAIEAERTGKTAAGIELGPLGTVTLRVVQPVFDGETLLGYVELGKEIEGILENIQQRSGHQVAITIHKESLLRETWEDNLRVMGRAADWDQLPYSVITYSSIENMHDIFEQLESRTPSCEPILSFTTQGITKDQTPWQVFTTPLKDAAGRDIGALFVLDDISTDCSIFKQKIMLNGSIFAILLTALLGLIYILLHRADSGILTQQSELREREAQLRSLFDGSPNCVQLFDDAGRFIAINRRSLDAMNWTGTDVIGRSFIDVWPYDSQPLIEAAIEKTLHGESASFEANTLRADGTSRSWQVVLSPIRDDDGTIKQFIGTSTDVTEERADQKALHKTQARLRAIMDSVQAGIILVQGETEHLIVDANPAAAHILGVDLEDLIGQKCNEYLCSSQEGVCPIFNLNQTIKNVEYTLHRADGTRVPILANIERVTIEGEEHLLESFIDITALQMARKSLEKNNQRIENLASQLKKI